MASYFEKGRGNTTRTIDGEKVIGGYRYDFTMFGQRHRSPRGYDRRSDCDDAEQELRRRLKLEHAGVTVLSTESTSPRFANWAGVYRAWVRSQHTLGLLKRPDAIEANISSVLRFVGQKPTALEAYVHPGAPYRDLTLEDFIRDPSLLRAFDQWMADEQLAGSTRNHYTATLSAMYQLALKPEYHDASGPPRYNPFRDRPRFGWKRRTTTLTAEQIQRWIQHASYHARLAIAIAVLNPKFRLKNILQLEWSDVDLAQQLITVWDHKTDDSGEALVAAMPEQLVSILKDCRERHPQAKRVILYRGRPVASIDEAVKNAAIAAKLPWGRAVRNGVTFHSIRHFASTQLARLGVDAERRKPITGHRDIGMELWYTHLLPDVDERAHTETLSAAVPIAADVTAARLRASRPKSEGKTQPAFSKRAGGISGAGGILGGTVTPNQGDLGAPRAIAGLRRGPQPRASNAMKTLAEK